MPRVAVSRFAAATALLALLCGGPARATEPLATPFAGEAAAAYDGAWTAIPPPPAGFGSSMVYDSRRDRMLMFGRGTAESWELPMAADSIWRRLPTSGAPTFGQWHVTVYDRTRDRVLAFGGDMQSTTWELPLSGPMAWAPVAAQGAGPGPLRMASAIYDPMRDRMVVFAGMDTLAQPRGELWELTFAGTPTWSLLTPAGSGNVGLPRYSHAAGYDSRRDRMLVFGGIQDGLRLSSVWACDFTGGAGWHVLAAGGTGPTARLGAAAAYDSIADALVVHGGYDGAFPADAKVLSLADPPAWSALAPAPHGRYWAASAFDPVRERLVLFGGKDSLMLADTWACALGASPGWTKLGGTAPESRTMASAVFDAPRGRLIVFGGQTNETASPGLFLNDVWALSPGDPPRWTKLIPQGTPPSPRFGHSAIYDPVRERMLVFGGTDVGQGFYDTWELTLQGAPTWTQLAVADSVPNARFLHSAIYDPVRARMVIAGGWIGFGYSSIGNDAWALSLSTPVPEWTRIPATYRPPFGIAEAAAIYDPVGDRLVLAGGRSAYGGPSLLTWALQLGGTPAWSSLGGLVTPSYRLGPVAGYDPIGHRLILYGGCTSRSAQVGYTFSDAWELPLAPGGEWREMAPEGRVPYGRSDAAVAFDPARDRMLVFGGASGPQNWGDAVLLSLSQTVGVPPAAATPLAFAAPWPNPASGEARFEFTLPGPAAVTLDVFDVSGRRVVRLAAGVFVAGRHALAWDGRDAEGRATGAGIYFALLRAGGTRATVRCVRLGGRP